MQYSDESKWNEFVAKNQSSYGAPVVRFAERWANLMEAQMSKGRKLEDIARSTEREADSEGNSGFAYVLAVSTLTQTWIHGDALRRWHNRDTQITQIDNEGEKANASGGVLNPAILNIK